MSFNLDIGVLPDPPNEDDGGEIRDTFDAPVAYKFAFIGVGQAGGRIARTFQELGYSRVAAVNTAVADLAELTTFPDSNKLDVGAQQGAGKDPAAAATLFEGQHESLIELMSRSWGPDVDYVFVCFAAGGGTGAGGFTAVAQAAKDYMRSLKKPAKVGCIMAMPKDSEGQRPAANTVYSVKQLAGLNLSPIIFVDNERFKTLYGKKIAAQQEKPASNAGTAKLFHVFNQLAGTKSESVGGTTFDPGDFAKLLDSGVVAFAAATAKDWTTAGAVSQAIRNQLEKNVLASVTLYDGNVAGLLYVISGAAWEGDKPVTVEQLDSGVEMLNRMLCGKDATKSTTVFSGVYPGGSGADEIQILGMIGGLPYPKGRLQELASKAGHGRDAVAEHLGIF
jgi:cell division GTPase FtsZ